MARLNTRISATPQPGRASTVDTLYRDPTPLPHANGGATARQSSYSVMSPAQSMNSDKENETPTSREETPRPRGKGRSMAGGRGQRLPTPDSGSTTSGNGNKRRRTGNYTLGDSEIHQDVDENVHVYQDEEEEFEEQGLATPEEEDDEAGTRFYNPQQDPEQRRVLRASIRNHQRHLEDNRDELIKPGNDLLEEEIGHANRHMGKIRQTADAALDSRVLVCVTDLAGKKLNASLHGNAGVGIDVDQFVSRCIFYMKEGRPAGANEGASTQMHSRRQTQHGDEEEEDTGEGLDWAFLGRSACFPSNKRPPVSSFLLGPLSVQKRVRTTQTRRARSQRQPLGPATRPQELTHEDIQQSENSNLTNLVKSINTRLQQHLDDGSAKIEKELEEYGDVSDEDIYAACRRRRVYQTVDEEPAVHLFDFAVNPRSFGQTVENLFYISFLIREGAAKVQMDSDGPDGLPLLVPAKARTLAEQREQSVEKHQAIFSIDWPTWKTLIQAYDIKEPLIPHRVAHDISVSKGGWYG